MLRASIDIGSNSILLLVVELEPNNVIKVLENESQVTGLGRDLDINQMFIDIAMEESLRVLSDYAKIIKKYNLDNDSIVVTATEATRVAKNSKEFINKVKEETGLNIQTITSEAEAFYSTIGILIGAGDRDQLTIMDIGGASTEVIHYASEKIDSSYSMPVGAVRYTNWLEKNTVGEHLKEIESIFSKELDTNCHEGMLYCVAGTMTSVGNMYLGHNEFVESEVHGLKISVDEIKKMQKSYQGFSPSDFLEKFPFLGKRSKTIAAGLELALWICEKLKVTHVEISTYGLRYGTIISGSIKDEYLFKQ